MRYSTCVLFALMLLGTSCGASSYVLSNGVINATVGLLGLSRMQHHSAGDFVVSNDQFMIELDHRKVEVAAPSVLSANATQLQLLYASEGVQVQVTYRIVPAASFVEKTIRLLRPPTMSSQHNVTNLCVFNQTRLTLGGVAAAHDQIASSHHGLNDYVLFQRWNQSGSFMTAQNPYLHASTDTAGAATICYSPMMLWTDSEFTVDSALLGVHTLSGTFLQAPADPLDLSEQSSMVDALTMYLSVPQDPNKTVKINIAWTENDFQLDIADPGNRTIYKRIIDRAAQFGITHLLFAPRNSDISCKQNNTGEKSTACLLLKLVTIAMLVFIPKYAA